ncbi:MAG: peptidoglycan-binding protein [Acidobacteriota bacterium]
MTIQIRLGGKLIVITDSSPLGSGGDLRRKNVPKSEVTKLRQLLANDCGSALGTMSDSEVVEEVALRVADGRWSQLLVGSAPLTGGSSAAEVAAAAGAAAAANAGGNRRGNAESSKKTWVEVELLDHSHRPVRGAKVEITLPDGSVTRANLSGEGTLRVNGIDPGSCSVTFPDLDGREWKRSGDAPSGAAVELLSGSPRIPSGAYTVKQGDYMASIAREAGFLTANTIWEDGANASLRGRRNANVLYPGDVVQVPVRQRKTESVATGEKTTFATVGEAVTVKLVVLAWDGTPLSNTEVQMRLDTAETARTAEDGSARRNVNPAGPREGNLTVRNFSLPLRLGHLDPAEEFSGQVWRLNNLGYRAGEPGDAQDMNFRSAVEEFQCDNGIAVTGRCDAATQDKLRTVHGS